MSIPLSHEEFTTVMLRAAQHPAFRVSDLYAFGPVRHFKMRTAGDPWPGRNNPRIMNRSEPKGVSHAL